MLHPPFVDKEVFLLFKVKENTEIKMPTLQDKHCSN